MPTFSPALAILVLAALLVTPAPYPAAAEGGGGVPRPTPLSCVKDGRTVPSGSSALFYSGRKVVSPATCLSISQLRSCADGKLSGDPAFSHSSCTEAESPDLAPPSVPTNLAATVFSPSRIDLSWSPSTDTGGSGIAGYRIFQDGVQIATTTAPSYSATSLRALTTYVFAVSAFDHAGNMSARSASVSRATSLVVGATATRSTSAAEAKSTNGRAPDRQGEIWIGPHEFAFKQLSGKAEFYPDIDQENNRVRDDYLAQVTNINNWADIVATGKTVVFGVHLGALSPNAFLGYGDKPFTDAQLVQLANFINANHFKVYIETAGLQLTQNEKLIADRGCPTTDMSCAGEGKRTARLDATRYLKRWLDAGGRIDYVVTDHALTAAARNIANRSLNIRLDAARDATFITTAAIIQELLRYFANIDAELAAYHAGAHTLYHGVGFGVIDGPSAYRVIGDRTGTVYPSRDSSTLLKASATTYGDIVNALAAQIANGDFTPEVRARLRAMPVAFDAGPQVVLADGNGALRNFERILTAQHQLAAAGFRPLYIIHPGSFAIGTTYSYTDADVSCLGAATCDKSPAGVLSLANEMSQQLHIRGLEEYIRAGGATGSVMVEAWHRYPSWVGPAQSSSPWFSYPPSVQSAQALFSWFNTAGYLARFLDSSPAIVGPEPATSTRGTLAPDSLRIARSLALRADSVATPYAYREDRYDLLSATAESYQGITMEQMSASSLQRGVTVSARVALGERGDGWFAVHFGKPTSAQDPAWQDGVSVLVADDQTISLVRANPGGGRLTTLATERSAVPPSKIVNLRILVRGATLHVYADYKKVLDYTLPSVVPLVGFMSIDSSAKDAYAYNVVTDWH